ncbi:MAG: hypothetical protein ABIO63_05470 [Casimicrobiaceae bacterium]
MVVAVRPSLGTSSTPSISRYASATAGSAGICTTMKPDAVSRSRNAPLIAPSPAARTVPGRGCGASVAAGGRTAPGA